VTRLALVALAAVGCAGSVRPGPQATDRPVGEDLLALLPSGADALVDVDIAQLDSWPTARRLIALMPAAGRAQLAALGDDPLAQLTGVVVAVFKAGTSQSESLVIARGELDWGKLKAGVTGGADGDYHGSAIVDGTAEAIGRITPTVFVFGSRAMVRRACDVAHKDDEGFRTAATDRRLRDALARAPTAKLGRPAIMAAIVPTQPLYEKLRAEKWDAAADLDWLAASFAASTSGWSAARTAPSRRRRCKRRCSSARASSRRRRRCACSACRPISSHSWSWPKTARCTWRIA
jgi:hypothetical protein